MTTSYSDIVIDKDSTKKTVRQFYVPNNTTTFVIFGIGAPKVLTNSPI